MASQGSSVTRAARFVSLWLENVNPHKSVFLLVRLLTVCVTLWRQETDGSPIGLKGEEMTHKEGWILR